MTSVQLSSAKYVREVVRKQRAEQLRARQRKVVNDGFTLLFGLFGVIVGIQFMMNLEYWAPALAG